MPAFLIFRISDLHEATQTPLPGAGGVNIIREYLLTAKRGLESRFAFKMNKQSSNGLLFFILHYY